MLAQLQMFAGLSWDPAIKGILVVLVGTTVLFGSIYLIVATNTGARLGMLISLAGLFGFLSILTMYWWISPPGNGPRGSDPSWRGTEIVYHEPGGAQGPADTEVLNRLPAPSDLPTAVQIVADHPELVDHLIASPENTSLSDIAGIDATNADGTKVNGANILFEKYGLDTVQPETTRADKDTLQGWQVATTSASGDAAATVDAQLVAQGTFGAATEYKRLNAFEWNEEPQLNDECPDAVADPDASHSLVPSDPVCRLIYRVKDTFSLWHPARYMVIQVQPVIAEEAKAGEPPPIPRVDPTQPVMSFVLVRNEGNVRAKPAYFFVICFALFVVFSMMLHYRDKNLQKNLDEADALRTGKPLDTATARK